MKPFRPLLCLLGLVASLPLLAENPDPTPDEVRDAISGNLCRCTGYIGIVEAILDAAKRMKNGGAQ